VTDLIPPKIAVLGAGLIGAYVGGRLAAAGADVMLIGRQKAMAELKRSGLNLTDYAGAEIRIDGKALQVSSDPAELDDADLILLTVKNKDTLAAAKDIAAHAKAGATVLSFQNGVSNMPRLREALPRLKVLAGVVPFNVTQPARGNFHQGLAGRLFAEADTVLARYLPQFEAAGLPLELRTDMPAVAWAKLLMNLNNAVNVASGLPLKDQLSQWGYRHALALSQDEALALLRQANVQPATLGRLPPSFGPQFLSLPDFLFSRLADMAGIRVDALARSSMADDLAAGRPTEIDYLNGEVVALAELLGKPAPVNRKMIELVHAREAGAPPVPARELTRMLDEARRRG
jgi:2-dehydropantoate 2-reductase